jgi:ribosomal protein S18 acetylase RimI-like enzyme
VTAVWVAAPHEAADVAELLIAFRDWFASGEPSTESMGASVASLIGDPATEYLLGRTEEGKGPCGVCQLRFRHSVWTATLDCWLEDLYVADAGRGRGVGRALVELACERARLRGAARIELDTNETNTTAIALYESLGFSATSKAHGSATGRDIFMGRRLGASQ